MAALQCVYFQYDNALSTASFFFFEIPVFQFFYLEKKKGMRLKLVNGVCIVMVSGQCGNV